MDYLVSYANQLIPWLHSIFPALHKVPSIWWHHAMNVLFFIVLLIVFYGAYYSFRRAFGHEKFKGRWYTSQGIHNLKQELYTGVREGRLPDSQTMAFLDKHIYGKTSAMRKLSGNGWL